MDQRKRVLVVDDERSNRELLEALLTSFGHDVDMAADGWETLEKLGPSHDLVLLDVMMPGIDGFEVARRIRNESSFPDIPICMVTALSDRDLRLRAVKSGVNDYIAKPIDPTELRIRATSLLKIKEAQDAVKAHQAKLEAQNLLLGENVESLRVFGELRDEFLAIASHDLKNPLTGILGCASLIESSTANGAALTEPMRGLLRIIIKDARIMQRIILDFLDFQGMEDGQIKLNPEPLDLNVMAGLSLEQNGRQADAKGITLALELEANLPPILADAPRIRQVVDNLVGNAIKFGGKQSRVSVRTRHSAGEVFFEVEDSGPGLTEEDMGKLFVKYAKLSNKPTGGEKSSGLGLAICKRMIDLNGGEIGGRNNVDQGSTFWFKFPVHPEGALAANDATRDDALIGVATPV